MRRPRYDNIIVSSMRSEERQALDRERNIELYKRLKGGEDVTEEMIIGNIPLVLTRVNSFLTDFFEYRHLKLDLQSEGYLALARAVETMSSTDVENPVGYIYCAVYNALKKFVQRSESFSPSRHTLETEDVALPQKATVDMWKMEAMDRRETLDVLHEIEDNCLDTSDVEIVWLREMGYVDEEIATELGVSQNFVWRRKDAILQRFLENRKKD